MEFLSTPSARRATDLTLDDEPEDRGISIHALREEGDAQITPLTRLDKAFLSTPSARRATRKSRHMHRQAQHFYPRPPRGGRRFCCASDSLASGISIHALREEGDQHQHREWLCWRISIHALREEGDHLPRSLHLAAANFYPRPPRGGRHLALRPVVGILKFLSTPSARRATCRCRCRRPRRSHFYPRPPSR